MFFSLIFIFGVRASFAQDDVYYDPNKDPAYQAPPASDETPQAPADKTDGYGYNDNPPSQYNPTESEAYQKDGDTYVTNNYYDYDEDADFGYTTRLRRYYTPNYGVDYYSYWFTPSFYFGWNSWNTSYMVSYNPWYSDPWWSWNRRVVIYDPFYSPYWSWNVGWNSCMYYNAWNPYGCWGYGGMGGYGYNNAYWNGYNNGYNNGYYDGAWSGGGYNNNTTYFNGPRRHRSALQQPASASTTRELSGEYRQAKPNTSVRELNIPREGIQKPLTPAKEIKSDPRGPYNAGNPNVVGKPAAPREAKPTPNTNGEVRPAQPKQEWTETPPAQWNRQPQQREVQPNRASEQSPQRAADPRSEPRENLEPRRVEDPRNVEPRRIEQPRMEQPRNAEPGRMDQPRMEQPRNTEPRRMEQPRMEQPRSAEPRRMEQPRIEQQRNFNSQPQRMEQPRNNFQPAPMQRSTPSHGGGRPR